MKISVKPKRALVDYQVIDLIKSASQPGEVGIEIEMEGNKFPRDPLPNHWVYKEDHSLRGKDNAEYIFKRPQSRAVTKQCVNELFAYLRDYGSVLDDSNRTSVHVHLNVQQMTITQLATMLITSYILEGVMTEYCGEWRVGNLFCMRAKDAPALVDDAVYFFKQGCTPQLAGDIHYANINLQAIQKFGSLEFRSMRGVQSPEPLLIWLEMLYKLKDSVQIFENPREVIAAFSGYGPHGFLEKVLGEDLANTLRDNIPLSPYEVERELIEGVRLAQELAYGCEWSDFRSIENFVDPFGRKVKKVMESLEQYSAAPAPDQYTILNTTPYTEEYFEPEYNEEEDGQEQPQWTPSNALQSAIAQANALVNSVVTPTPLAPLDFPVYWGTEDI